MSGNVYHRLGASSLLSNTILGQPNFASTNPHVLETFFRTQNSSRPLSPSLRNILTLRPSIDRNFISSSSWTHRNCQPSGHQPLKVVWLGRAGNLSCSSDQRFLGHSRDSSVGRFFQNGWNHVLSERRQRIDHGWRRYKNSSSNGDRKKDPQNNLGSVKAVVPTSSKKSDSSKATSSISNNHILSRLPSITYIHRPTKEELLSAATGFWSRLKVRFKWFSIRSVRPFNIDEIGAFFSWFLLGHVLWIILGTTTFFSLAIFAVNTVFAQGMTLSCFG